MFVRLVWIPASRRYFQGLFLGKRFPIFKKNAKIMENMDKSRKMLNVGRCFVKNSPWL